MYYYIIHLVYILHILFAVSNLDTKDIYLLFAILFAIMKQLELLFIYRCYAKGALIIWSLKIYFNQFIIIPNLN